MAPTLKACEFVKAQSAQVAFFLSVLLLTLSLCRPLQGLRNKPKKTGHVKPDLIDVDLVRGESKDEGFDTIHVKTCHTHTVSSATNTLHTHFLIISSLQIVDFNHYLWIFIFLHVSEVIETRVFFLLNFQVQLLLRLNRRVHGRL